MSFVKKILAFLGFRTARAAWISLWFLLLLFLWFLWLLWSNPGFFEVPTARILVLIFLAHWFVFMLVPCWALFTKKGRIFLSSEPDS